MRKLLSALAVLAGCAIPAFGSSDIHVVDLDGVIHPVSSSYIAEAIERADGAGAAALVIQINTPGGLVDSTKEIVQKIFSAKTPVIGFVTPSGARAASGGFYVLIACDVAAMAPGTNTGAAHPVTGAPNETKDDIMMQKAESDLAAFARSIAENRRRNVAAAESAVRDSISWTENEAAHEKLIDLVANDLQALLKALDGRSVRRMSGSEVVLDLKGMVVRSPAMTIAERAHAFILRPEVALLLLALGLLGLYVEFTHPGLIAPGVVGLGSLFGFAYAARELPISVAALLLIAAGVVLLVLEIKIVSHGLLGLCGVVALVSGSLLLFKSNIPEMRASPLLVLPTSLALAAAMFLIALYVARAQREPVATGREGMIGEIGVATTEVASEGKIFVHGEYWNARANAPIQPGVRIRIRAVEEMCLLVEPAGREA